MQAHFAMMAAYNTWANRRLYDACAALPEADVTAGLGAFFGSLHGTLNHLLVADRIWMARFAGEPPAETRLDAILHEGFAALRGSREAEDARIEAFVARLDDASLALDISYTMISRPGPVRQPLGAALAHFFNHQTHHRGQCHAMLTRLAAEGPSLDLVLFQRETGTGLAA
jgi:uncharacterized damage-inducible protein DinB